MNANISQRLISHLLPNAKIISDLRLEKLITGEYVSNTSLSTTAGDPSITNQH